MAKNNANNQVESWADSLYTSASVLDIMISLTSSDDGAVWFLLKQTLGKEKFIKFLEVFSGETITVPDLGTMKEALKRHDIYAKLAPYGGSMLANNQQREKAIKDLSERYNVSTKEIRALFKETVEKLKATIKCANFKKCNNLSRPGRLYCDKCLENFIK